MKAIKRIALAVLLLLVLGLGSVWMVLRASLPALDGSMLLTGLSGTVLVERDDVGAVSLRGEDRADLAQALGFAHAQDRFFQMDLSRRMSAGELSALVGPAALETDRSNRIHRFREVARRNWASMSPDERSLLEAYARGVNQGLESLTVRPFEYWLLASEPKPWLPEDCMLVLYSMFLQLNDGSGAHEAMRIAIRQFYSAEMAGFLQPAGGPWDAPLEGGALPPPQIPGPEQLDLRELSARVPRPDTTSLIGLEQQATDVPGSNNWAVAGWRSGTGKAMLANDMHLGIQVPNTWYRARLQIPDKLDITGVTLPGVPAVVAGSNGKIAWGFTNSYGDWVDLVALEIDPQDPGLYRTATGWWAFESVDESIEVKGQSAQTLAVRITPWGPVVEFFGNSYALAWTAHDPAASNLNLLEMEQATSVEQAMAIASRAGTPPQNFVVADDQGNIGWTIMGRIPRRGDKADWDAAQATRPESLWQGWLDPLDYPRILNPKSGLIWTANSRVVSKQDLAKVGDGGYALGARGMQIRDDLMSLQKPILADMLAVQLDDRALFLEPWRNLLLELLDAQAVEGHPERQELQRLVEEWTARASVDSVGYRIVRAYRLMVQEAVYKNLMSQFIAAYPDQAVRAPWQFEASLWQLVTQRPLHLLDPVYQDWEQFLLQTVDDLLEAYSAQHAGELKAYAWGELNVAAIRHPLSGSIPLLGDLLNMPAEPLPGDTNMPRVQGRSFGASERFAVSPGTSLTGYFHMPGGQSGHPLSDYYRRGHESWAVGKMADFQPAVSRHVLELQPAGR
ncbi:MAG: penicillin acylase family protein [Gammaproteobacteria bacterium]|nr:penicillin acylase family protein [Gammaproteobacteria bacterium]